jgi:uncharacterized membrane protein
MIFERKSEPLDFSRSYVRDGMMRAYANRFGVLAFLCAGVALVSLGLAIYVRMQPPTIIRISPDGEANVISGRPFFHRARPAVLANASASPEPMGYEKERMIRDFLDDYLNYDYRNIGDRWADALNLATDPLKNSAIDVIKKEDRLSQARAAQVRSTFEVRQIEPSKSDPLAYTVFGIRNVYRMDGTREIAEQMVNRYEIRLAMLDRSSQSPRGLLIAKYDETQLEGETKQPSFAVDTGGIAPAGVATASSSGTQQ